MLRIQFEYFSDILYLAKGRKNGKNLVIDSLRFDEFFVILQKVGKIQEFVSLRFDEFFVYLEKG